MAVEDTLARVELFADLEPEDLRRLAKVTVRRNYSKGDLIVSEGEAGVAFYVIASGRVDIVKGVASGNETLLDSMGPGGFFGEMALFDNQVRSASVRAAEDCELLALTKWDFNAELTSGNCRIAIALIGVLARRIRSLSEAATH